MKAQKVKQSLSTLWRSAELEVANALKSTSCIAEAMACATDNAWEDILASAVKAGAMVVDYDPIYSDRQPACVANDSDTLPELEPKVQLDSSTGWRWLPSDSESKSDEDSSCDTEDSLRQDLADWSEDNRVTGTVTRSLLQILRKYHPSLPQDPRTLLGTPTHYNIQLIGVGEYCHVGLAKGLSRIVGLQSAAIDCLELPINVDGIPLFKIRSMCL